MSQDIILHHYWLSPFSERVRHYLSLKGLAWRSVEAPNIAPKPDLVALTGGYRKAPVLQIGADIFCDSQIILRTLERRFPEPRLMVGEEAYGVGYWVDRASFLPSISLVLGTLREMIPPEFIQDREAMFPDGSFNVEAMSRRLPQLKDQWRAQVALVAEQLSDSRPFLFGDRPGVLDVVLSMNIRLLLQGAPHIAAPVLAEFPELSAWVARIGEIGQGDGTPMTAAEALAVARDGQPQAEVSADPFDPNGLEPGMSVDVAAEDYGGDPVRGEVVFSNAREIAVRRRGPEVGEVVVHFPRAGFSVRRA